jgi:hypothetical protein
MAEADFAKIKRNIGRMIDQGAPETDIDEYLSSEGVTAAQLKGGPAPRSGSFLPITRDETGLHFDSNAGILGAAKKAFKLPAEVMSGQVDPKSDEGIGRAFDLGSFFSPVNPAVRAGDFAIPGAKEVVQQGVGGRLALGGPQVAPKPPTFEPLLNLRQKAPRTPTQDELLTTGANQFEQAKGLGVDYSPEAVKRMGDILRVDLDKAGLSERTAPTVAATIRQLQEIPPGAVASTLDNLHSLRMELNAAYGKFTDPAEQRAAKLAIDRVDEFIKAADPRTVLRGKAAEAGGLWGDALGNYAAGKRSQSLSTKEDIAALRAGTVNSGQNFDNALRQRVADIPVREMQGKGSGGFNAEELAALTGFAEGGPVRNTTRHIANLLGGGGGLGQVVTAGIGGLAGSTFGPIGTAIGAGVGSGAGMVAKALQNSMAKRALGKVDEKVRARSPLAEAMVANPGYTPKGQIGREAANAAIIRMLMGLPPEAEELSR